MNATKFKHLQNAVNALMNISEHQSLTERLDIAYLFLDAITHQELADLSDCTNQEIADTINLVSAVRDDSKDNDTIYNVLGAIADWIKTIDFENVDWTAENYRFEETVIFAGLELGFDDVYTNFDDWE